MIIGLRSGIALAALWGLAACSDDAFKAPPSKPLSPREELMTFRLPKGFVIELVASEPDVVDPVALAFDEKGRLFVAEMRGYPNGGVGTGKISSGRIRMLEDKDGDGVFETSTIFADGLRFPTSVMPYGGGLLVANAPDLIYLEDSTGEGGKPDKSRVLYTGFDIENIQQLLSGLQWGLDNWIHACAGGKGGTIRCPQWLNMKQLVLRGRGIRFRPDEPGQIEPTSGGGQYGLTQDDWGHWFTATNSQHLRQIVLPDHYLARNPNLAVPAVTIDIPDHGAACKVHRISPFESWRVERTKRRKDGPDSKRFPNTELVPGGFITSACSPLVYSADLFPKEYRGSVFVCDPANNLIHRDILVPNGPATFTAKRGEEGCEFLASTDNWFRPVWLTLGPDGAIYIADFYREVIETPLSLPEDMKKVLPLHSQGRGRIWRLRPEGKYQPARFDLRTAADVVSRLDNPNAWWRLTAQRLLVEAGPSRIVDSVKSMFQKAKTPQGRVHALRTLEGLNRLDPDLILQALEDAEPLVRFHGLQVAEPFLAKNNGLRTAALRLADDASAPVRFQLAHSAGAMPDHAAAALAKLALRDGGDPWMQTAILSSCGKSAYPLLEKVVKEKTLSGDDAVARYSLLTRLAALVAAQENNADLAAAFKLLSAKLDWQRPWQVALVEGLGQGLQPYGWSVDEYSRKPSRGLADAHRQVETLFSAAAGVCADATGPKETQLQATRMLTYASLGWASKLKDLLRPSQHPEVQLAAVRALAANRDAGAADILLEAWGSYSPALRREVIETLLSRRDRVGALLDAIEKKQVLAGQLEPARLEQLRKYPDAAVRDRAAKLLAGIATPAREKIVAEYRPALDIKGDAGRGKAIFKKNCATCHRLDSEGTEVGPDLLSALANKTPERLLVDILDPSREVDPRFIDYVVVTTDGRLATGMIASETAASVTIRRAEKVEETILRNQIESITATAKSLMPEGLERQISQQEMSDLIAYLVAASRK